MKREIDMNERFIRESEAHLRERLEMFLGCPTRDNANWLLMSVHDHMILSASMDGLLYNVMEAIDKMMHEGDE